MLNNITGDYEMYEKTTKAAKKTAKTIVDNLSDIAKPKGEMGKGYLKKGKSVVDVDLKTADATDVGKKLGTYIEKQVDSAKKSSKKINIETE